MNHAFHIVHLAHVASRWLPNQFLLRNDTVSEGGSRCLPICCKHSAPSREAKHLESASASNLHSRLSAADKRRARARALHIPQET